MDLFRKAFRRFLAVIAKTTRGSQFELVRNDFYSPLPDIKDLKQIEWGAQLPHGGVDLKLEQAAMLLSSELSPLITEFEVSLEPPRLPVSNTDPFPLENGGYGSVDAELLYAMIRHHRPNEVLELGSGASSHVIERARIKNEEAGYPFRHQIIDPFPFGNPIGPVKGASVTAKRAEDMSIELIDRLQPNDILFVDTTHTVKTGSDVLRVILEFLPSVAPGVLIHFHDIFTPYDYPRSWIIEHRRCWAEQYMLQAFLAYNTSFEVVLPAFALTKSQPEVVSDAVPSFSPGVEPGALWMRRV